MPLADNESSSSDTDAHPLLMIDLMSTGSLESASFWNNVGFIIIINESDLRLLVIYFVTV